MNPGLRLALSRDRRVAIVGAVGFAAALAAASQVAIPLPGSPVPFTLQPLVVALAGLWLGPAWGAASMLLYIAAGAAGLPVFAPTLPTVGIARLIGPTGGYLLAYPAAAWAAGRIAMRWGSFDGRILAAAAAVALLHLGGIAMLALHLGSAGRAVELGSIPFMAFDVAKVLIAAGLSSRGAARPTP